MLISLISKNEAINLLKNTDLSETSKKTINWKNIKKMLEAYIKIEKLIKFGVTEIQKQNLHQNKGTILIKNIDIYKIVVSNKISFGKKGPKYFIGYKDAEKLNLYVFVPKMSAYRKDFDETKFISFLIKDDQLEYAVKFVKQLQNSLKKEFDSEPVYKMI